jgi:hypothetical protein
MDTSEPKINPLLIRTDKEIPLILKKKELKNVKRTKGIVLSPEDLKFACPSCDRILMSTTGKKQKIFITISSILLHFLGLNNHFRIKHLGAPSNYSYRKKNKKTGHPKILGHGWSYRPKDVCRCEICNKRLKKRDYKHHMLTVHPDEAEFHVNQLDAKPQKVPKNVPKKNLQVKDKFFVKKEGVNFEVIQLEEMPTIDHNNEVTCKSEIQINDEDNPWVHVNIKHEEELDLN